MEKPTDQTPYLFVYGTLMSGLSNNRLLKNSLQIDTATTEGKLTLLASSIPYLVDEKSKSYVTGEVYEVDEKTLSAIDQLEGHPGWYSRKIISIVNELGDKMKAWAYFMPRSTVGNAKVIESGSYRDYIMQFNN